MHLKLEQITLVHGTRVYRTQVDRTRVHRTLVHRIQVSLGAVLCVEACSINVHPWTGAHRAEEMERDSKTIRGIQREHLLLKWD